MLKTKQFAVRKGGHLHLCLTNVRSETDAKVTRALPNVTVNTGVPYTCLNDIKVSIIVPYA